MNLKVLCNLLKVKKKLTSNNNFKADLWTKLSGRWQVVYHNNYHWYQTFVFRVVTVSVIAVIVLGSLGTGAYAYTSPEVTDGTILYPVKQSLENIIGITKVTPTAKAKFYLNKIKKREAEKQVLEKRKQVVNNTEKQIESTEEQLAEISQALQVDDVKLKKKVEERLEKRKEKLEEKIDKLQNKEDKIKGRDFKKEIKENENKNKDKDWND